MFKRTTAVLLCLVYLGMNISFGVQHDHGGVDHQFHEECSACAWHFQSVADEASVEIPITIPFTSVSSLAALVVEAAFHPGLTTANRGPPVLS